MVNKPAKFTEVYAYLPEYFFLKAHLPAADLGELTSMVYLRSFTGAIFQNNLSKDHLPGVYLPGFL